MPTDFDITLVEDTTRKLFVDFVDEVGVPADPAVVELVVLEPDANVITKTKALAELTNPSVGRYEFNFKFDQVGNYAGSWFGETAASNSSVTKSFAVEASDRSGV